MNTERRSDIIRYIAAYRSKTGYSPSVREIMSAVGLKSPSTLHGYMVRMEQDGYLIMGSEVSRTVSPTKKALEEVGILTTDDTQKLKDMIAMLMQENHELRKKVCGIGH